MPKRLTLKEVKEKLAEISPTIEILSDEYVNSYTRLQCRCKTCGYEWETNWINLLKSKSCAKCSRKAKLTIKDVIDRASVLTPTLTITSTEYVNTSTGIEYECNVCGYHGKITVDGISAGHGCKKCGIKRRADKKRLTLDYIKEELHIINKNIQILDTEYNGNQSYLNVKCLKCGIEWKTIWSNLKNGHGCPTCKSKKISESKMHTLQHIRGKLKQINNTIEIVSSEYNGNREPLDCKCLVCGEEWTTNWFSLVTGHGCHNCSGYYNLTFEIAKERLHNINKDIIISDLYSGNSRKICDLTCCICGHKWSPSIGNVLNNKSGCPICARDNNGWTKSAWIKQGVVSQRFESFKLYILKCTADYEEFYKIGITFVPIERRYSNEKSMPYNYEVVKIIESDDGEYIWNLEKVLHRFHRKHGLKYKPLIPFGGSEIECFKSLLDIDKIIKEMEE